MIRALLDANIYISYLLAPGNRGSVSDVVDAAEAGLYVPLLPEELVRGLTEAISRKKSLSTRIKHADLQDFVALLSQIAEELDPVGYDIPAPAITRDRKDDYLLTYAVIGQADYLVTGDRDLLVLDPVGPLRIVTPAEFLAILGEQDPTNSD